MQFPLFQVPYVGHGMIIGTNGVIHVLISHGVAIGLFGMLVLADWKGWRSPPEAREGWDVLGRRMLRFIALAAAVAGAVTGTGIWFTTSALASRGMGSMLRIFYWAWFTEWIVFFLEVVGLLVLYYAWDTLGRHRRLRIALSLSYVVSGILSAVLITGNLGFMLTPGAWVADRSFFSAFLNPTFLPQLLTRISIAYVLGALIALVLVHTGRRRGELLRTGAARLFGTTLLVSVPAVALSVVWYLVAIPEGFGARAAYAVLTEYFSRRHWLFWIGNMLAVVAVLAVSFSAILRMPRLTRALLIPAAILAVGFVAEFERIREFIRGPFLMPGYMYVSGVLMNEQPLLDRQGMLSVGAWPQHYLRQSGARGAGAFLFAQNCSVCHTTYGINPITRRVRDRSDDGVRVLIRHTQEMTSFMPPFVGTEEERTATARFLIDLARGDVQMRSHARLLPEPAGEGP